MKPTKEGNHWTLRNYQGRKKWKVVDPHSLRSTTSCFFQGISKFSTPKSRSNLLKTLENDGNGGRKRGRPGMAIDPHPASPSDRIIRPFPGETPDLGKLRRRLSAHTTNGTDGTQSSEIPRSSFFLNGLI